MHTLNSVARLLSSVPKTRDTIAYELGRRRLKPMLYAAAGIKFCSGSVKHELLDTLRQSELGLGFKKIESFVKPIRKTSPSPFSAEKPFADDSPSVSSSDELWMEEALRCAQRALEAGEVPVGAVVIRQGVVIGRGWNQNLAASDPTAHAEMVALREAGRTVGNHRLVGCDLFATIEPCAMCAGAIVHARVRRLVYGAEDPKAGAVHSVMQVANHPGLNHQIEIQNGVLAGRSAEMLQEFFRRRRERKS